MSETRPFEDFRDSGLLWLVNASVFHPRGYALALVYDDNDKCVGWQLFGDGTTRWTYAEKFPDGVTTPDDLFHKIKELMP